MHNARFRLMAAMAGATMCLFAATANGQNTNTTTGTTAGTTTDQNASASTEAGTAPSTLGTQPGATGAATTGTVDNAATTQTYDNTAPTTTVETRRGFPWGLLGLLGLLGLMKRGTTEVRRDTYAATTATRNVGTTADDRMNLTPRAASGTGTGAGSSGTSGTSSGSSSGSMGDPNARR